MTAVSLNGLIEQMIYTALTRNSGLMAIVAGVYDTHLPPGTTGTNCVYQYVSGGDENFNLRPSADVKYRIEVISNSRASAINGSAAIYDAILQTPPPAISGWTTWRIEQQELFNQVEDVLGVIWYRKGGFWRISIDNA